MENTSEAITALTSLIDVNNKRMQTYQSLAEKARQDDLKAHFRQCSDQSRHFSKGISLWRAAYGGFAAREKTSGLTSVWVRVKSLFEVNLNKNVMAQCKELE